MIFGVIWDFLLFVTLTFVVGAACAPSIATRPTTRLICGIALALGGQFGIGFIGFAMGFSNSGTAAVAAALGVAGVVGRRHAIAILAGEPDIRRLLSAWLLFAAWSVGLLALVVTYSGGGWAADWIEHWQRTVFFLERQPLDTRFAAIYPLTARPPLANLIVALWLGGTTPTFAHFQLFMTLLGTLIMLPVWSLAERWAPARSAGGWALLASMANPLVAQNLTFAWTKLPTAFFVLAGLLLTVEALGGTPSTRHRLLAVACFALALLTHYSAAPWVIAATIGIFAAHRAAWTTRSFWRGSVIVALGFVLLLSGWISWAVFHFGWHGAAAANTTAGAWHLQTTAEHVLVPLRNIVDTIVPFPLRGEPADGLLSQTSRIGRLRDVCFNLYQLNLLFAFGFASLWVFAQRVARRSAPIASAETTFHQALIPAIIVLGVLVHTPRDEWGLVHICLQPLILLGLAYAAGQLATAEWVTRVGWAILALIDVVLGIGLQFGLESEWLGRFITPNSHGLALARNLSRAATANANDKAAFGLEFFADTLHVSTTIVLWWLAGCAMAAVVYLRAKPARIP